MRENDMALNLDALGSAEHNLLRTMDKLEKFAAQLVRNMTFAGGSFNSVNFERAKETIGDVMSKLAFASEQMRRVRDYLNEISDKAEIYFGLRYAGGNV